MNRRWLAPALWAGFIFVLTSLPGSAVPTVRVEYIDKVVHFSLYAVEALLIFRAIRERLPSAARMALVVVGASAMAAVDEWHQQFIPGRSQDRYDWIADTIGAGAGVIIAAAVFGRRETIS